MIAHLIERFAEKAPAALMFRGLFARLFSDEVLDRIFSEHRVHQVDSTLLFSYLVRLLVPVISTSRPSVHASHQASDCKVSRQALYDKLKGVEPAVSSALVRSTVGELRQLHDKTKIRRKDIIPGFHAFVVDGKMFNATEHRLWETRFDSRSPLPGRGIAILDTRYELFVDVECDPNAYRCERKILEPLISHFQAGDLYLLDRNFSDGNVIFGLIQAGTFFLVRQHGACPSCALSQAKKGVPADTAIPQMGKSSNR